MKNPKINSKKLSIAPAISEPTPKETIEAIAPSENSEPKKSAYQKDAEKVKGTLEDLKGGKQNVSGMFSRVYSIPSDSRSKIAKLTGQVPNTVNVYGSHFPVVRMMNDGKTLLLHTSNYGNDGKTTDLVNKIKQDLPSVFPDAKVIEIHHPDYRHSAKVMRIRDEKNVHNYLENASQNHPDENYRQHAIQSLEHLKGIKKAEYSKPIHAKRTASEGWDYDKNVQGRLDRLHQYLSRVGLTPDLSSDTGRKLGADMPTSLTINREGDPHDQQVLHEAAHAMLTPAGKTLGEYQAFIGKPGFEGKLQAAANRQEMQQMHGGGMPEQTAQQMEAGIARRAGIEPFRSPKRGASPTSAEEKSRAHAKRTLDLYDQGIQSFDPFTGEQELGSSIDALINAKTIGNADLTNKIREKFKQHVGGHRYLEDSLAASEKIKPNLKKSILEEMFGILKYSSNKVLTEEELPKVKKPFKSKRQRRFLHAHPEKIGGKEALKEWENKTPKNIPESVRKKDVISGGLADKTSPSQFNKKKLKEGAKVEMEHTSNKKIAQEIAMDHLTEDSNYYKKLKTVEKIEIPKPIKAAALTTALASAGHQMISDDRIKPETRQAASQEMTVAPQDHSYNQAYNEGMKIGYIKDFEKKPSNVVIKETIKSHPDLSESHGYVLKLSPNAFKEVIQHNSPLVKEVGSRHYDHLFKIFNGDHDKIRQAWQRNVKSAKLDTEVNK